MTTKFAMATLMTSLGLLLWMRPPARPSASFTVSRPHLSAPAVTLLPPVIVQVQNAPRRFPLTPEQIAPLVKNEPGPLPPLDAIPLETGFIRKIIPVRD